jgi:hypothetical protein
MALFLAFLTLGEGGSAIGAEAGRVQVDSAYVRQDTLLVQVSVGPVLNRDLLLAVTRGATSAIRFEIRLWRVRRILPDELVRKVVERTKLYFEPLEIAYAVSFPDTSPPTYVDVTELESYLSRPRVLRVTSKASLLPPGTYYLTLTVVIEPLALESYREIQRWLRGEAREAARELRAQPHDEGGSRLLGVLVDLIGLGNRAYTCRSAPFELPRSGA